MRARLLILGLVGALVLPEIALAQSQAQNAQVVAGCGSPNSTYNKGQNAPTTQDTSGNTCVTTTPSATTWQATMTLAAATSTTLVDANVTKTPNSAATPASFGALCVINTGTNDAFMCQFGGTCSATAGGETIKAGGGSDCLNISPGSVPSFFSTSGTSLSFRNGS